MIDLKKIDPRARNAVSKKFIAEIVEFRLAEIMEFVNNELKHIGRAGKLPAGVVLVGGGAKMNSLVDLVKQELKLPAQVGAPDLSALDLPNGEVAIRAEDPESACVMGLLMFAGEQNSLSRKKTPLPKYLKKWLNYLMP
jgi:cell division protein FtsA